VDIGNASTSARLLQKLSLADVEETTKIRPKYLEALEENNFANLPPGMYGRAFLRTYARLLGLNAEELVAEYRKVTRLSQRTDEEDFLR